LGWFAVWLGLASSLGLALVGFTPLVHVWYETISGLSRELADFAIVPTRIMLLLPATSVLVSLQRGLLVHGRFTRPITWATVIEVGGIVLVLMALTRGIDMIGVTAAAIAFVAGRLAGSGYLVAPGLKVLRGPGETADTGV
jgi:O-antigen/teichoic acid export membrane protein